MMPDLPEPVAAYLAADNVKDPDLLAGCFADDALVHDEDRDDRGRDAIRAWRQAVQANYRYVVEPLAAAVSEETVQVRARLTGDFPGSPVEVAYTFTLADDTITALAIG